MRYGPVQARVNYAKVPGDLPTAAPAGIVLQDDSEEILGAAAIAITNEWWVLGNLRYDIQADQTITDGLGLRYQDDCFNVDVTYQRSFIRDQDIEPDQRFLVNFALKYLGSYSVTSEAFGTLGAEGSDFNE